MKTALLLVLAAGLGFAAGTFLIHKRDAVRHAVALAKQQEACEAEKASLEDALAAALIRQNPLHSVPHVPPPAAPVTPGPAEIIARLQTLKGNNPRTLREAVYWLAELANTGTAALPSIREFLARNQDVELDAALFVQTKVAREVPLDFVLPPSLRFGLFHVVRQIGGLEAEQMLAETLGRTARGIEVVYLARALQEMAPHKYRDQALTVARDLLASGAPANSSTWLDRGHRDHLYAVLAMYHDASFTANAQAQLVQPDGQIDRTALKYLQEVLGVQSVALAAQAYEDPRVSDSARKEPLARLALSFVGADPQANEFYHRAINDPVMTPGHRKNLIEDLNEDGLNFRNLTQADLPVIQNRLALIDQLAPGAMDKVNAAAFQEARKDLINMAKKLSLAH